MGREILRIPNATGGLAYLPLTSHCSEEREKAEETGLVIKQEAEPDASEMTGRQKGKVVPKSKYVYGILVAAVMLSMALLKRIPRRLTSSR